jgi:hypothetical protein
MPQSSEEDTLHERENNDERQQNEADGGESGEKGKQGGDGSIGFWHQELSATRNFVFRNWVYTSK